MAASDRASEFFHGTVFDIPVGDRIVSGDEAGHSFWGNTGHHGQESHANAFATTDEGTAWHFAGMARDRQASDRYWHPELKLPVPGRAAVYKVHPNPMMQPGVHNRAHPSYNGTGDLHEYVAPSFKTYERVDIQPGRQGTFPQLNWAQFQHPQISQKADVNHPGDGSIEGGHRAEAGTAAAGRARQAKDRAYAEQKKAEASSKIPDGQLDLFTGKPAKEMASGWSDLAAYHRRQLPRPEADRIEDL